MNYVIGIDGGGTKTTCLFMEAGQSKLPEEPKRLVGKGANPHIIGFEEAGTRLVNLIRQGLSKFAIAPQQIVGVGCGLAGVGRQDDEELMTELLRKKFYPLNLSENCHLFVTSDSVIALKGALPEEAASGMLVIAGTGSNAIAMDNSGKIIRCGGWGHLIGDEGSGYYISLKALSKVSKAVDGRGRDTAITSLLLSGLHLEQPDQLISYMYGRSHEKHEIARLAKYVIAASEQGDEVAIALLQEAADELLLHAASLHRQSSSFTSETPVTAAGSIFQHSTVIKQHFIEQLHRRRMGTYCKAFGPPEFGACLLAK
ncbi:N-acetylglucosamine kinase [Halobacillus halophilus]|uniref:N-acetylglucosamine kinase n=1 Tax=Halobacillus halophilus TaxID=1570 RepID=UPI001CD62CD4|nr:BadF/BadG/BcrA/BcrD ATPase family protein [Halobacillus halophilus]MCA1010441.1 ATPase [Halobacillus halophilus]